MFLQEHVGHYNCSCTNIFYPSVAGDVLNNFPMDSVQANTARILLAFSE